MSSDLVKFNKDETYYYRSSGAAGYHTNRYTVKRRTTKTIWLVRVDAEGGETGEVFSKRVKEGICSEYVSLGSYSMAPCIYAQDVCTKECEAPK